MNITLQKRDLVTLTKEELKQRELIRVLAEIIKKHANKKERNNNE